MIDQGKKSVLGVLVDVVDYDGALARILESAAGSRPLAVTALAVHGVMTAVLDADQRYRVNHIDLVVPDGQPVRWGLNILHRAGLVDRVYGPELMLRLCEACSRLGLPIFLFGSSSKVLGQLRARLAVLFPELVIAGSKPSQFRRLSPDERDAQVAEIASSGAALCFVGLGCPRQEAWVYENRDSVPMPLIAVGAAFDFHAGTLPQAPAQLQRLGFEWAFRLAKEPHRLWRRYLLLNPLYLTYLALQLSHLKRFAASGGSMPPPDLRYG